MWRKAAGVVALAFLAWQLSAGASAAQSLEEKLQQFGESTVKGYMRPVVEGFGADMNSGLWHSAKTHGLLGFDVSVKAAVVTMPDEAKTFVATAPPGGYAPSEVTTATAVGEKDGGATLADPDGAGPLGAFDYPGGLDLGLVPLAVPQVTVGVPMHTDVMIRYLPAIEISDDVGEVKFWGLGVKHSVSQYLPMFPLDVSAYFARQKFEVGDFLKSTHTAYGIIAGKSLPVLTVYGGFGFESSSMDLSYDIPVGNPYNPGGTALPVTVSIDSDASSRFTVGARLTVLPLIYVNAEMNKIMGSDNLGTGFAGGVGLSIR